MKTNLINFLENDEDHIHALALESLDLERFAAQHDNIINNHLKNDVGFSRQWNIGLESSDENVEQSKSVAARILEFIKKIILKIANYIKNLVKAIFGQTRDEKEYRELEEKNATLQDENASFEKLIKSLRSANEETADALRSTIIESEELRDQVDVMRRQLAKAKMANTVAEGSHSITKKLYEYAKEEGSRLEKKVREMEFESDEERREFLREIDVLKKKLKEVEGKFTSGVSDILKKRTGEVGRRVAEVLFARQDAFKDMFYLMHQRTTLMDMYVNSEMTLERTIEGLKQYILASDTKEVPGKGDFRGERVNVKDEQWYRKTYTEFKLDQATITDIVSSRQRATMITHFSATLNTIRKDFNNFQKMQKDFDEVSSICNQIESDLKSENDPAKINHMSQVVAEVRKVLTDIVTPAMAHISRCMTIYLRARDQHRKFLDFGSGLWKKSYQEVIAEAVAEGEKMSGLQMSQSARDHLEKMFYYAIVQDKNVRNNFNIMN